jgi:hypothetical protein
MPLSLHLQIEQRRPDRAVVLIELQHEGDVIHVTGAAIELRSAQGILLSPRMLLPIAGDLTGPLATRVELRATQHIPHGSQVYGVVFFDGDRAETSIPVDPCTELQAHVRGMRVISGGETALETLDPVEEYALQQLFPWTYDDRERDEEDEEDEASEQDDVTDEVAKSLGLDEEETAFLREILTEEVPRPKP